jgi:hypothetical protein
MNLVTLGMTYHRFYLEEYFINYVLGHSVDIRIFERSGYLTDGGLFYGAIAFNHYEEVV